VLKTASPIRGGISVNRGAQKKIAGERAKKRHKLPAKEGTRKSSRFLPDGRG